MHTPHTPSTWPVAALNGGTGMWHGWQRVRSEGHVGLVGHTQAISRQSERTNQVALADKMAVVASRSQFLRQDLEGKRQKVTAQVGAAAESDGKMQGQMTVSRGRLRRIAIHLLAVDTVRTNEVAVCLFGE